MLFFVLLGGISHGAHGLLRFRTDDVLLGTSGVGVRIILWCLISSVFFVGYIGLRSPPPRHPLSLFQQNRTATAR